MPSAGPAASARSRPLRVALVNDYQIVVEGLARLLEPYAARIAVVELAAGAGAGTGRGAPVDVALYDSFSQTCGVHRPVSEVRASTRTDHLVVYSWNLHRALVEEAMAQGASGYLAKSLGAGDLVAALERVAAGETVVSPDGLTTETPGGDWPGRSEGLTSREAEVVALITQGLSNADIAERAFLSINSVKSYIRSGYRKMGVDSRSRAVLWGIAHGFRPDHVRVPQTSSR